MSLLGLEFLIISKGSEFLVIEDEFRINATRETLIRYLETERQVVVKNCSENISAGCFFGRESVCEILFEFGCILKEIDVSAFLVVIFGPLHLEVQIQLKSLEHIVLILIPSVHSITHCLNYHPSLQLIRASSLSIQFPANQPLKKWRHLSKAIFISIR
jgi:hypothetical protein